MRGNSSAPEIGDAAIVERVAELYVDAVARLDLPRVVLAPKRTGCAMRDSCKELTRQGKRM